MSTLLDGAEPSPGCTPATVTATATARLARARRQALAGRRERAGERAWVAPDVLPWSVWLERLWSEAALVEERPLLLDAAQSRALWEQVVAETRLAEAREVPALAVPGLAAEAERAWALVQGWCAPETLAPPESLWQTLEALAGSDEQRAFARWARAYAGRCRREGWTDAARLPLALAEVLSELPLPAVLRLEGFDDIPPASRRLLAALAEAGVRVEEEPEPVALAPAWRVPAEDAEAERRAMAAWVRERLEAGAERLLVVAPRLAQQREAIDRALARALRPGGGAGPPPWEFSLGQPLADYPLVDTALALLGLDAGPAPWSVWSRLLRSPFLDGAERERETRARLDARLRERAGWRWSLSGLLGRARAECPLLAELLGRLDDGLRAAPRRQSLGAWAADWTALLGAVGWPGEAALDSAGHQTVEAWRALLERLAALEAVTGASGPVGRDRALGLLRRQAQERVFQPESVQAPVQVVGLLEAAGLAAEGCWLLDAGDEVLPAAARPSALLPFSLQRRLGLPQASAVRELALAERRLARLRAGCAEVLASHPLREGDRVLRPSPLIQALPVRAVAVPALPRLAADWLGRAPLEALADARGPGLAPEAEAHGGTAVFSEQSACPFRAFARLRLDARTPAEPVPGLDAAARGTLVHQVLEAFWQAVGSQARLLALGPEALAREVAAALDRALASGAAAPLLDGPAEFLELERARLARLLEDWLELERERAPFEVEASETERRVEFAGLALRLKLDRIDRLDERVGGGRLHIDYKTSQPGFTSWLGERPREPQLPLYAVTAAEPPVGIAFARLRPGELQYIGLAAAGAELGPGFKAPPDAPADSAADSAPGAPAAAAWDRMLAGWRAVLERLGRAHAAGEAAVDPRDAQACGYCDLQAFCRVHERRPAGLEGQAEDGGEGEEQAWDEGPASLGGGV